MKLHKFEDAREFYLRVKNYLLHNEPMHYLLLGISNALVNNPEKYNCQPYLATVELDTSIIAVAIQTPPRPLLLSQIGNLEAVKLIAQDLYSHQASIVGVNSPNAESEAFAKAWTALTGQSYQLKLALRAFQLEQVQVTATPPGYLRAVDKDDKKLLMQWHQAFVLEALGEAECDSQSWVNYQLKNQTAYLWENQEPVSLACQTGITPNGTGIGTVYTPKKHRGKGYATACVAKLSQYLLKKEYKYCFLFTDLANPTANHIYQSIGYQPVGDWREYSFCD
jgi:uncharacterized protein